MRGSFFDLQDANAGAASLRPAPRRRRPMRQRAPSASHYASARPRDRDHEGGLGSKVARSFPAPKSFFFRVRNQTPKTAPVFPKTCRFQTLSGWLRTTPRLRNEIAVRYAAMESRNSTPGTIDFRSFTWTSTVQTAGIEESCPSGAELPVGARMIRIKWMN